MAGWLWSELSQLRQRSVIPMFSYTSAASAWIPRELALSLWCEVCISSLTPPPFLLFCWKHFSNPRANKELLRKPQTQVWLTNMWILICHCPLCSVCWLRFINPVPSLFSPAANQLTSILPSSCWRTQITSCTKISGLLWLLKKTWLSEGHAEVCMS